MTGLSLASPSCFAAPAVSWQSARFVARSGCIGSRSNRTGSYDGIFGEQTSLRYKNVFFETNVQFTLRGDGTHQYHFANDLIWSGGPGYYFVRQHDTIVGFQLVASGEYKDVDRFRGKEAKDTGITSVFLGPRLLASRGRWSAEVAADLPVSIHNTALQVVPDYRLHAGISVQL